MSSSMSTIHTLSTTTSTGSNGGGSNSSGTPSSSTSTGSQFHDMIRTTPPVTFGIIALCTMLYVIFTLILDVPWITNGGVTFCPKFLLYPYFQWYRIVTSVIFHIDSIHLIMNMMSSLPLCTVLEQQIGSLRLLYTVFLSIVMTSIIYISIAIVCSSIFQNDTLMNQHSIGFSGIFFHLMVLECHINTNTSNSNRRNLFGMVEIPAYLYPWVLLLVIQILIPNVSFMGHLSGIISGTMQVYGLFNCVTTSIIHEQYFVQLDQRIQQHHRYCPVSSSSSFVPTNTSSCLFSAVPTTTGRNPCSSRIHSHIASVQQYIHRRRQQQSTDVVDDDDDGEWNGLPSLTSPSSSSSSSAVVVASNETESLIV